METRHWTRERISFDVGDGEDKIILYLYLPNAGLSRYQTVLFWTGPLSKLTRWLTTVIAGVGELALSRWLSNRD